MRVLIIEDERPAARRLTKMVADIRPDAEIADTLDSVEGAVSWLKTFRKPDLIFMDIQLADGLSFSIFEQSEIDSPVIFTTAYDQYAVQAFKVNSIDYLLKPIDPNELRDAIDKFDRRFQQSVTFNSQALQAMVRSMQEKKYKTRFLIKKGQQLHHMSVEEAAYFYSDDGMVRLCTQQNKQHLVDYTLDQLEQELDPAAFFRINRKAIVSLGAIRQIHTYFNSRLKVDLQPASDLDGIVSRDRVSDFKKWLNQ